MMEILFLLWKDKRLSLLILCFLFFLFSITSYYSMKSKLADCKLECVSYKNEISQLRIDSQKENQKYKNAYNKAKEDTKKAQEDVNKILYANVSKSCEGAMSWSVMQAKDFDA